MADNEIFNEQRVAELTKQYQEARTDRDREVIFPLMWREMEGILTMLMKKIGPMQQADYEDLVSACRLKFLRKILPKFDAARCRRSISLKRDHLPLIRGG